jgi:group I intron endonuclease
MAYIYKIVNQLNNKIYVGQTHREPAIHWKNYRYSVAHHKKYRKYNRAILDALVEIGMENFEFSIIEECLDEQLNERERYWIRELNTNIRTGGHGYNLTIGGQDRHTLKPQRSHLHTPEAKEKIRQAHKGRCHKNWRSYPITDIERQNKSIAAENQKVKIERWSLDGVLLQIHDSRSAASQWLIDSGLSNHGSSVLARKIESVMFGFRWRRVGDDRQVPVGPLSKKSWIPVTQYDLDGNEVQRFVSISHAVAFIKLEQGKANYGRIINCMNKKSSQAYGYLWK